MASHVDNPPDETAPDRPTGASESAQHVPATEKASAISTEKTTVASTEKAPAASSEKATLLATKPQAPHGTQANEQSCIVQPSQNSLLSASTVAPRRPIIHTPRSRRTHVPKRQPPASKNLRWTAFTVHTLLSACPSKHHDAHALAERVASLASSNATNHGSSSRAKSEPINSEQTPVSTDRKKRKDDDKSKPELKSPSQLFELGNPSSLLPAERNARRRVHDTLKVMAAAGCIQKQGKRLHWIGVDHLRRPSSHPPMSPSAIHPSVAICFKRHSIARKTAILTELQRRVRAYTQFRNYRKSAMLPSKCSGDRESNHLFSPLSPKPSVGCKRRRTQAPAPHLSFPFLLLRAHDPDVLYSADKRLFQVSTTRPLRILSETDLICLLAERQSQAFKKTKKVHAQLTSLSHSGLVPGRPTDAALKHEVEMEPQEEERNVKREGEQNQKLESTSAPLDMSTKSEYNEKSYSEGFRSSEEPVDKHIASNPQANSKDTPPPQGKLPGVKEIEASSEPCAIKAASAITPSMKISEEDDISLILGQNLELPALVDGSLVDNIAVDELDESVDNDEESGISRLNVLDWMNVHSEETFDFAKESDA